MLLNYLREGFAVLNYLREGFAVLNSQFYKHTSLALIKSKIKHYYFSKKIIFTCFAFNIKISLYTFFANKMKFTKSIIFLTIFFNTIFSYNSLSQNIGNYPNLNYQSPLKHPMSLSGDFGEIRSNHFHMGADIRLRVGKPVYAVEDGYISRYISEPGGYGNALYIDHPEGYRSVYCHLNKFAPKIKKYVDAQKLASHRFRNLEYFYPEKFPVKKGDLIGFGGNSGYSFGPHLHFEIRRSQNDAAINPYHFLYFAADNRPPEIYSLLVTPANAQSSVKGKNSQVVFRLNRKKNIYSPKQSITASGKISLAVEAFDRRTNQRNKYAVYKAQVYVDNELIFEFKKDEIPYEETRYMNSFSNYIQYQKKRKKYTNLYREKGNMLNIYSNLSNDGYIEIEAKQKKKVRIKISDFNGNTSELRFNIKGENYKPKPEKICENQMKAGCKNYFIREDFRLMSDENSFYDDFCLNYRKSAGDSHFFSDWHSIYGYYTPIHYGVRIALKTRDIPTHLLSKICLIRKGAKGKFVNVGGSLLNGFMTAEIRYFGQYAVYLDTIPPKLTPENFKENTKLSDLQSFELKVEDDMSRILKYEAEINNTPVIADYDLKNDLIIIAIPKQFLRKEELNLHLKVYDTKNNMALFSQSFKNKLR